MPPIIAVQGTKDAPLSSSNIAQPISRAAIPPNAVNVRLSHCMLRNFARIG
jgi:hypothetical protein